jgi:hypothetical protein
MPDLSLDHHHVPVWYQRRFLTGGVGEFYVLNKEPQTHRLCPDGRVRSIRPKAETRSGPLALFQQQDLYSVALRGVRIDAIERFVFGPIDRLGAKANELFLRWPTTMGHVSGDEVPEEFGHPAHRMLDLLQFIDAQRTRTLRGIDQLKHEFARRGELGASNNVVMAAMLTRRQVNCTVWAEGNWEIFSARNAQIKFLLSDEPVVMYNCDCYPGSTPCLYPHSPDPFWCGTRVIYPLSSEALLVISHAEHTDNPSRTRARRRRRNARSFDQTIVTYLDILNYRQFGNEEVAKINYIIKTRARRYVASENQEYLYPERIVGEPRWSDLDRLFYTDYPSFHTQSELMVRYNDDSLLFSNAFGERQHVPGWFVRQRETVRRRTED